MKKPLITLTMFFLIFQLSGISQESNAQYSNYNIASVEFLEASYPANGFAHVRVEEPDMNKNQNNEDSFLVKVWSDTDGSGISILVKETGRNSSVFEGIVYFTATSISSGETLRVSSEDTITVVYSDSTLPSPYGAGDYIDIARTAIIQKTYTSSIPIIIELDQKVYSWTDRVFITVVSTMHNSSPEIVDIIGDSPVENVIISTRQNQISNYRLVETSSDTGIFTGEVVLSGFQGHDANGDGIQNDASGVTKGIGPDDGYIETINNDAVTVSVQYGSNEYAIGTALVRWTIGEASWLEPYATVPEQKIRVVDPDMNLNPNVVDMFPVDVWSDTDSRGTKVIVSETSKNTGIFEGVVMLTSGSSGSNILKASNGDTLTLEYGDNTLPDPYTTADELDITGTNLVSFTPPMKVSSPSAIPSTDVEQFESETKQLEQESQELAEKQKELELEMQQLELKQKQMELEKLEAQIKEQEANQQQGGCLIATAAFGTELAPQVQLLREIRDNTVVRTHTGTVFMSAFNSFYYSFSPTIADWERQNPLFKETVKVVITPLLSSLTLLQYVDIDTEPEMLGYGIGIILLNIGIYFVTPVFVLLQLRSNHGKLAEN